MRVVRRTADEGKGAVGVRRRTPQMIKRRNVT
jgi:hypothetical protein